MKTKIGLVAALVVGVLVMFFTAGADARAHSALEYKVIYLEDRDPQILLNQQSKEGWELVTVTTTPNHFGQTTFYLKRPVR